MGHEGCRAKNTPAKHTADVGIMQSHVRSCFMADICTDCKLLPPKRHPAVRQSPAALFLHKHTYSNLGRKSTTHQSCPTQRHAYLVQSWHQRQLQPKGSQRDGRAQSTCTHKQQKGRTAGCHLSYNEETTGPTSPEHQTGSFCVQRSRSSTLDCHPEHHIIMLL